MSILGGLLIGLSYSGSMAAIFCFVAFVPMLIVAKNSNLSVTILYAAISSAAALLVQYLSNVSSVTISSAILQFLIFALPWVFYQLIRFRHNEKLAYLSFVSSWIFLEWIAAQYFVNWVGLQLGHAAIVFPSMVQLYDFLGVSAGSIWILAINIHISRIILPAQTYTGKYALINGILVLTIPILVSFFWTEQQKSGSISGKIKNINDKLVLCSDKNEVIYANEKKNADNIYDSVSDTVQNATITYADGKKSAIPAKKIRVGSLGGIKNQYIVVSKFAGQNCGLLNSSSLLRADLIRLYAIENCGLLISYDEGSNVAASIVRSRALENNLDILVLKKDEAKLYSKTGGQISLSSNFNIATQKHSFFSLYGDLSGRLSIFVSIWMLLGTIVKPFRKK